MVDLYDQILSQSQLVDEKFISIPDDKLFSHEITFSVPSFHPRSRDIQTYSLKVVQLNSGVLDTSNAVLFVDQGVASISFLKQLLPSDNVFFEEPREDTFKEYNWISAFLAKEHLLDSGFKGVIAVGGGLTLNASAYVAELLNASLTLVPTTIIGMADGSGGKVRLNRIDRGRHIKHYYKSFYEPSRILVDPRFLDTLSERHVSVGLGEIVKHGVFQSRPLLDLLISDKFRPYTNRKQLLKAILWAAELKSVCLRIDVEENANGSRGILRGGHEFSDRIEEDSHFHIPHGHAVAMGIYRELELEKSDLFPAIARFFDRFNIPKSVEEFYHKAA